MAYDDGQNPVPLSHSFLKRSTNSRGTQTGSPNGKAPKLVSLITKFEGLDAASVGYDVRDAQQAHLRISRGNLAKWDTASRAEDRGKVKRVAEQFMSMAKSPERENNNSGVPKERTKGETQHRSVERTRSGGQSAHNIVKKRVNPFNEGMDPHKPHAPKVSDQGKVDHSVASRFSQQEDLIVIAKGPSIYSTYPCENNLLLTTPATICEKRSGQGTLPSVERDPPFHSGPDKQSTHNLVVRKEHEGLELLGKQFKGDFCRGIASQSKPTSNFASGEVDSSIERLRKYYCDEISKTISWSEMQEDNTAMKAFYSTMLKSVKTGSSKRPAFPTTTQGRAFPTATEPSELKAGQVPLNGSLTSGAQPERLDPSRPEPNRGGFRRLGAPNNDKPGRVLGTSTGKPLGASSALSLWPLPAYIPYGQESQALPLQQLNPAKKRVRQSIEEVEKPEERRSSEGKGKRREEDRSLFVEISRSDFGGKVSDLGESTARAHVPTPIFQPWPSPPPGHNVQQEAQGKGKEEDRLLVIETSRPDFYKNYSNWAELTPPRYVPTPVFRSWTSPPPANDVPQKEKGKGSIEKGGSAAISLQEKHYMRERSAQMATNARQELRTYQKRLPGQGAKERHKLQARQERFTRRSRSRPRSPPSMANPKRRNDNTKENSFQRDAQDLEKEDLNAMDGILQTLSSNQEGNTPAEKSVPECRQSDPEKDVLMMDVIVAQSELAQPKPHRVKETSQIRKLCGNGLKEGQRLEGNRKQKPQTPGI